MHKMNELLDIIYEKSPTTGNYIAEVSLDNYSEIFSDWDSAPLRRKDIHPELMIFLEDCLDDIPLAYNVDICLYLNKETPDKEK